jgi:hypothetical protein
VNRTEGGCFCARTQSGGGERGGARSDCAALAVCDSRLSCSARPERRGDAFRKIAGSLAVAQARSSTCPSSASAKQRRRLRPVRDALAILAAEREAPEAAGDRKRGWSARRRIHARVSTAAAKWLADHIGWKPPGRPHRRALDARNVDRPAGPEVWSAQ